MNNHAELLRQVVGTETKGAFWSRELDMGNSSDAKCVAAQFGGSEWLHNNYPILASAYDNTVRNATPLKVSDNKGFCDKAKVLDLGYDSVSKTAYAVGAMNLKESAQSMVLTLTLYANDKLIGRNTKLFNGVPNGNIEIQVDDEHGGEEVVYHSYLQATWQLKGEDFLRSMVAADEVYGTSKQVVKSISITHPVHKVTSADDAIKIAYNRNASDMDYTFDDTRSDDGNEKIKMLVEGKVILNDDCKLDKVCDQNVGMLLSCSGFGDILYLGTVKYGKSSDLYATIFPLLDENGFCWFFDKDWNNEIVDSVSFGNRAHDFILEFAFKCMNDDNIYSLLISSIGSDVMFKQPHVEKISKIHLYWGCLARGTSVSLATGETKNIEDIKSGDSLMNPEGGAVRVTELVIGTEKDIYNICLDNGMTVMASKNHPFATQDGFVSVIDMTSETALKTSEGISRVKYCYPSEYNSSVYSLRLEAGDSFYANGIVSGCNDIVGKLADKYNDERLGIEVGSDVLMETARMAEDYNNGAI